MACSQIIRKQHLKTDIQTLWDFVSSPINLNEITPKDMQFRFISNNKDQKMYPGMIILYKVSPLFKIPLSWATEITHIKEKRFFVDEQRLGPYKIWHHEHHFEKTDYGVLMKDIVTYAPPFGIIGSFANSLFIRKKVNEIFDYREAALERIFK